MSCAGCDKKWGGFAACHCTVCHETFTTVGNFDRHRKTGKCEHPTACGFVQGQNGVWHQDARGHSFPHRNATSHDLPLEGINTAVFASGDYPLKIMGLELRVNPLLPAGSVMLTNHTVEGSVIMRVTPQGGAITTKDGSIMGVP